MDKVHPAFFFTGILMVVLPFLFLGSWKSRRALVVRFFVWGLVTWCIAFFLGEMFNQMFKGDILRFISSRVPLSYRLEAEVLYIALIFTLIECSLLLLVLLRGGYKGADWNQAISLGLGYGFIEMLFFGLLWLLAVGAASFYPAKIPAEVLGQLQIMPWMNFAAPVIERCFTFLVHIYTVVLISYAVRTVRWGHLVWAIVYKLAFYGLIAYGWCKYGYRSLMVDVKVTWNIELAIVAFGGLGLAGLLYLGYGYMAIDDKARREEEEKQKGEKEKKGTSEDEKPDGGAASGGDAPAAGAGGGA